MERNFSDMEVMAHTACDRAEQLEAAGQEFLGLLATRQTAEGVADAEQQFRNVLETAGIRNPDAG